MTAERIPLDRIGWARRTISSFAASDVGAPAIRIAVALVLLMLGISAMNVVNSYVGRDFMTSIEQRDSSSFLYMALVYLGVFAVSTLLAVLFKFCEERLGLLWRQWLTRVLLLDYLGIATPYRLREQGEIDNPDQRIADDVRMFTTTTLSFVLMVLNGTITIIAFSGVLWSITPELFAAAVAYAAIGSLLAMWLGRPLIGLSFTQSEREASFRADLVHLRENAESVALQGREDQLGARLQRRVDDIVVNTKRIIAVNRNLGFFTTGYNYMIQIIPALIVVPIFIRGEVPFGVIPQSAMAFAHLLGAFSLIITQFQQISSYAVVVARLSALVDGTDRAVAKQTSRIEIDVTKGNLAWQHLTLRSPHDGRVLVDTLSVTVPPGLRVLVTGPNEAGRIALFRATAGLWHAGEGRIAHPPSDAIMFIPERPYLPPGTLRQSLAPNGSEPTMENARIVAVLGGLGLESVVARAGGLDVEHDWDDVLSLGEQQQLAVAHVVLAAPRLVLLDRPGTLLGPEDGARALDLLAAHGITCVTFASEHDLAPQHDALLELADDGSWTWQPTREQSPAHELA